MAVRVALSTFALDLSDPEHRKALGPIGDLYFARVNEIFRLIVRSNRKRKEHHT
jgi:hypothetical protein